MSDRATVMIVDDAEVMRLMLAKVLGDDYRVVSVSSGEECLAACAVERPDLILLDVDMPKMSGYETCRRIKAADPSAPPVVFISGLDHLQDRLQGYDVGGDDYIAKPLEGKEVRTKVALRLKAAEDRSQLKQMADTASCAAMAAMCSMSEMGVLLLALQRFNNCSTLTELAQDVLKALAAYDLKGLVALRTAEDSVTLATHGAVSPIEMSIIGQVASMGRIVEYRSRMSVSYDHASLLISNMTMDDNDRRGRLRDHLAVLAESAELRTLAIHRDHLIERAVVQASRTLDLIDESQRQVQVTSGLALHHMNEQLERAYFSLGLSDAQESHMATIVGAGIESLRQSLMAETDVQQQLSSVIAELKSITASKAAPGGAKSQSAGEGQG
jgi:DNA-binding response OmpR family regulator